jgi:hypothetical protein
MHPLVELYGENALDLGVEEIKKLALNSNIPFDKAYVNLGMSFLVGKATELLEGKKEKPSLASLVSESFGEAAIYKYNVCNGVL